MKTLFNFISHQLLGFISNISDMLEMIFRMPFRQQFVDDQEQQEKPLLRRVLGVLLTVLAAPIALLLNILLLPFRAATVFSPQRRKDFLWGLPAAAVLGVVIFAVVRVNVVQENITNKYRGLAQRANLSGDFKAAKTYYGRLVSTNSNPEPADMFNWAISLSETGDLARAIGVFESLAPAGKPGGYEPAHRINAKLMVANGRMRQSTDPAAKKKLLSHLKGAGEPNSPKIHFAWSEYYLAIENEEKALEHLLLASEHDPGYLLPAADVCVALNDMPQYELILARAESAFTELKKRNPNSQRMITVLANIYTKQKKYRSAEKLLKQSLLLEDNKLSRSSIADYYLKLHDLAIKENKGFKVEFEMVQKSIESYVYHVKAYEKLVATYQRHAEGRDEIRSYLEDKITSGEKASMVHFSLSNVMWMENEHEEARWHVEQAYKLDPSFSTIANNLAWFLAHEKNPDLERAFALAHEIVRNDPRNARFNDTLATILMKQQRWDEAVTHFQKALPGMKQNEKIEIHKKLAVVYSNLNKPNLARLHREKSLGSN